MENLSETFYADFTWELPLSRTSSSLADTDLSEQTPEELLLLLHLPSHREVALSYLVRMREACEDLPLLLWNSFNTVFILLQEILSAYKKLQPPKMTARESTRVCNAIALFQCIASHPQTRMEFVKAKITFYLHPFLGITANGNKPLEWLRLTSLGVFGALVKGEGLEGKLIVHFLLKSEFFPMCLRCMELGDELTQTVSAWVILKIVMEEEGLKYCTAYGARFFQLVRVLAQAVDRLPERQPCLRLLRLLIRCYLRLCEAPRAMYAFKNSIPARMTQEKFINFLREDPQCARMLQQLFLNVTTH